MAKRSVLFYRDFERYSGGHQKVFDYFSHLNSSDNYRPEISFSRRSQQNSLNPWFPDYVGVDFTPTEYDYLFLAGMDWNVYSKECIDPEKPVINLIQHVRHALEGENVYPFLKNRAIRICVSPEVESAIKTLANGPVITIANGIDIPQVKAEKIHEVYIAGQKNLEMAKALKDRVDAVIQTEFLSRSEFIMQLAAAKIAVVLPHPTEGFFLPALEAMKLAHIVIVPDCIGNRSFCKDAEKKGGNCLMPSYDIEGIVGAIQTAKEILSDKGRLSQLQRNALKTVKYHSISRERREFLNLMSQIDELWYAA
jgi:hypothetical protein